MFHSPASVEAQPRRARFASETPKQIADHCEIDRRYRRKGRHPKNNVRLAELYRFINDRFGPDLPFDDEGADLVFILACHLAHLPDHETIIREMVKLRASWYVGVDWLIEKVARRPIKLHAANVGRHIGLVDATRTRLKITTIRAIDAGRTKLKTRRARKKVERERTRRANAGARPHAMSTEQQKPWVAEGISRAKWYRLKQRNETGETVSCPATPTELVVGHVSVSGARGRLRAPERAVTTAVRTSTAAHAAAVISPSTSTSLSMDFPCFRAREAFSITASSSC